MEKLVKRLRIFVAFASDCDGERRAIHRICKSDPTVKKLSVELEISLECLDFADVSSDVGRPQSLINLAVKRWKPDWFIFIFWQRLGSEAGLGMTGMEEEWRDAIEFNRRGGGHPRISLYFNRVKGDPLDTDVNQLEALETFKKTIFDQHQALATSFTGLRKFREQFRSDLSFRLIEIARGIGSLDIDRELTDSSKGLLHWPRTVGVGDEIQRPELQALLDKTQSSESSTSLILGPPGSGKSALLAGLGHKCLAEGFSVLAIKADMLGKDIRTPEDLRQWLHLSLSTSDSVKKIAENKPVIVLVDQLDAVSELVDKRSDRLNVLLNLIHNLSGHRRVHIIASSRDFECRHDIRLNSLNADRLELTLPSWDDISPILAKSGYDPTVIGESTRDLLRSPWCLKVFLDVAKPGMIFSTLQSLLEEVWAQRVVASEWMKERIELLEHLAKRMSVDETLWLPSSVADNWLSVLQKLEQEDILRRGPDGNTIGFRHQTYYDYTLARAFAKGALSLSDHVIRRQDGLFVRPALLSGLLYLRGSARPEYHRQIRKLFQHGFRPHIRSLLIEFLGAQQEPDEVEVHLVISLLKSPNEGPRVLASTAGSPGWFKQLMNAPAFLSWMRKPHDMALHCLNLLCLATQFDESAVLDLLERHWLPDKKYDDFTTRVFSYLSVWTDRSVTLASKVLERTVDGNASLLVDKATESAPELAPILLRAALDARLRKVETIATKPNRKKHLSIEKGVEEKKQRLMKLIEEETDWYNLDVLAQAAPKSFLDHIWPWFQKVISKFAYKEHEFVIEYRSDLATFKEFDGELPHGPIVKALLVAITRLAEQLPDGFIELARESSNSDLLIVQRLLARGFLVVTSSRPQTVLEYLLADPRRLVIGDHADSYRESKALITALSAHLTVMDRELLEEAVIQFQKYRKVKPEWTAQERFDRKMWVRQDRLRLLRAFPIGSMSTKARALRDEEERAFPMLTDHDSYVHGGWVGPRMTAAEMEKASKADLLRLVGDLPDRTEWDNPKRQWRDDYGRGGGAIQQSRELGELAKRKPEEVMDLLEEFREGEQEIYAGAALEGLAQTEVPASALVPIIKRLDEKGFSSGSFREGASHALKIRAEKDNGLSQDALSLLEKWLALHPEPNANVKKGNHFEDDEENNDDIDKGREILFGHSPIWSIPHGRGPIIEAIAEGYLRQDPPNYISWAQIILSRIGKEKHPSIWVMTLMRMPSLFNWDRSEATKIFDQVIRSCPSVLGFDFALYPIANIVRLCQPKTTARGWIDLLEKGRSKFSQQAYGEFLFVYHCRYDDSWSRDRMARLLRSKKRKRILLGLAHGASHLWKHASCRTYATKVLEALASTKDTLLIHAVGNLFRLIREDFEIDPQMHRLILKISENRKVIQASSEDLIELILPLAAKDPKLVLQICNSLLKAGRDGIVLWSSVPENLTNIALTLHRQKKFRVAGLKLFESLLAMNLGEAKAALEVLDRNPVQKTSPYRPRRSRRRKVAASGS